MAQTRTYQVTERGGSTPGTITLTVSTEGNDVREFNLAAGVSNKEVDLDLAYTRIKGLHLSATGLAAGTIVTLLTNSIGAPDDTVTFTTPGGLFYASDTDGGVAGDNPFSANVTTTYWTHDDPDNTGAIRLSVQYDPTP